MTLRNGHGECFYCQTPRKIGEDCECDGAELEKVTAQRDASRKVAQHFKSALEAVYEAGRMSDESRAQYCAEIAKTALDTVEKARP